MTKSLDIVLLHGWAIGSGIWGELVQQTRRQLPDARVTTLDLPGYGKYQTEPTSADLAELANACLNRAPEQAIWVGWSLGGMIAMQAALLQPERVLGLQLINTTPKFVESRDWPFGVAACTLAAIEHDLIADKHRTLRSFAALQAGNDARSRSVLRSLTSSITAPDTITLLSGLHCLAESDLRDSLQLLSGSLPTHLVCGVLDKVIDCNSSVQLTGVLNAPLLQLEGGHAVFLTHLSEVVENLASIYTSIANTPKSAVNQCA